MASLADPLKRSYLLVTAPTALALDEVGPPKDGSDLGRRPYTSWPAVLIARRGFAREERLKRYHDQTLRNPLARPARFLLGGAEALQRAFHRIETQPALAGDDAFWLGRFDEAADAALAVLSRFRDAWCTAGYLHPLGNPVASRSLAPAAAQYHSLDHLGKLTDPQRREGAVLIADLAHLLARRDTYPWHLCHQPPEVPYERYGQSGSVYRGMLNQNFHTDFYAFVGLAGCVLPGHPRAKHWRRHAIRMFREQMEAFVWPDTEGYAYWEESHTYANHVKLTLLPLMLALRDLPGDEAIDLLNDPHDTAAKKFRSMCRGMLAMLSPPDRLHEGRREVAAIGDHGYWHKGGYGSLFGYLASVFDADRDAFLWAWRQCGSALNGEVHAFVGPLLTPEPNDKPIQASPPTLPALLRLEGLGAIARRGLGTAKESLLVVRCGDAWGHHHPDEGSFWWWHQGHLVACDAGFGTGEHKLRHTGHSVLGWRDFAPIQHLDRHGFRIVDDVMLESLGETRITCDIPVLGEQISSVLDRPLPNNKQGLLRRVFTWSADGALSIMDEMRGGPSDRIEWRLWCPSERFVRMDDRTFHVQLKTGLTLALRCDEVPTDFETHGTAGTAGLFLRYESPNLTHHVTPIENR